LKKAPRSVLIEVKGADDMKADDMKDKPAEKSVLQVGMGKLPKSPYARPVLRVFGSVGKLTKGVAGTAIDQGDRGFSPD
jgi:hypothetical protein